MAGSQAVSSLVQLSALTTITSIPREKTYNDFPVTVRVRARETTAPRCPLVDIVALVDVSGSVGDAFYVSDQTTTRLEHERKAMEEVARHFGGGRNRLAVVAFNNTLIPLKNLKDSAHEHWRRELDDREAMGDTDIVPALKEAVKILDAREVAEKQCRPAFIILLSDGFDPYFKYNVSSVPRTYPIHAFGFWADADDEYSSPPLEAIPNLKLGTYTPVDEHIEKVTEKLRQLSGELTSMLVVDTRVGLRTVHPGVTLSRVEVEPSLGGVQISEAKDSGEVSLGVVRSGDEREFTVYLNVPAGPPGNNGASSMELLTVGGSYRQSWDDQLVALGESVVAVARPGSNRCKELVDGIEERLEYWCKVKQDLYYSGFNDGSCKCQCLVSEALQEASLETINIAIHQDIYMAAQYAIKMRHCGNGGTTMENAPSPTEV